MMIDLREHGIGVGNGMEDFFGDGSDGIFNPSAPLSPIITAPSGGSVSCILDGSLNTYLTAPLEGGSRTIIHFDFGTDVAIKRWYVYNGYFVNNESISNLCARHEHVYMNISYSSDNKSWTNVEGFYFHRTKHDKVVTLGELISARYWRLQHSDYKGSIYVGGIDWELDSHLINNEEDSDIIIKQYANVNIPENYIYSTSHRCNGIVIYSQGDIIVNGRISMDYRGGINKGYRTPFIFDKYIYDNGIKGFNDCMQDIPLLKGGAGGSGGSGGNSSYNDYWYYNKGGKGADGSSGRIGAGGFGGAAGGGSSSSYQESYGDGGDAGSVYNEVGIYGFGGRGGTYTNHHGTIGGHNAGGGGGATNHNNSGGGAGGSGPSGGGGAGGCGNGGDYGQSTEFFPGGFIALIAKGDIIINAGGKVTAKGGCGGFGGAANCGGAQDNASCGGGGGAGGHGGGVIMLLHKGEFINNGELSVAGGRGATGGFKSYWNTNKSYNGSNGSSGGIGTIVERKL